RAAPDACLRWHPPPDPPPDGRLRPTGQRGCPVPDKIECGVMTMAEYLAPGVYIEEIPSANKPIQAASTSTAGVVGMTERGPVGRPELVTSLGAYNRLFGGRLNPQGYPQRRGLLPFAVEGFFANGGSRLYVVRVVGDHSRHAQVDCLVPPLAAARSALRAPAGTGRAALLVASAADFAVGERVLVGGDNREDA